MGDIARVSEKKDTANSVILNESDPKQAATSLGIPRVGQAALSPPQIHILRNGGLKASRPTWPNMTKAGLPKQSR